jgi:Mg2+ and Co2+ transporter CorA
MALWQVKVDESYRRGTSGLDLDPEPSRVIEQSNTLNQMRANLREFQRHTPLAPSPRYSGLIQALEKLVTQGSEQVQDLLYEMNYFTAIASLKESKLAVQVSEQGIAQNARVKTLTQLAFVFIPLSAVASLFGMNLVVLKSGAGEVWMFIVGVIIAYSLVFSFWGLLHPSVLTLVTRWMNADRVRWQ